MLEHLIDFFVSIWRSNSEPNRDTRVGESEMERQTRHWVMWISGGIVMLLCICATILYVVFGR